MKAAITRWTLAPACVLAIVASLPVQAAEFCVTNSTELQNALTAAASNGEADTIRIAAGNYLVVPGGFVYDALGIVNGDDHHLTLIGGWTAFGSDPCGQLVDQNPFNTVLSGGDFHRVLNVRLRESGGVTVSLLAFQNGRGSGIGDGGGLRFETHPSGYGGTITVERNAFVGNHGYRGGGLNAGFSATGNGRVRLINNLFVGNHAELSAGAASLNVSGGNEGPLGAGIFVANNTMVDNTVAHASNGGGLRLVGSSNILVANNNLWGNMNRDLEVSSSQEASYSLLNNNVGLRTGTMPSTLSGNISVEPEYEPCCPGAEWVPVVHSPLVDGGIHPPNLPFPWSWHLTVTDLRGMPRVSGPRVDIGAYESHDRLFYDRFGD